MSAQILEIGEFRIKRERQAKSDGCKHDRLTLDDDAEIVICDSCEKQVGSYAALRKFVDQWDKLQKRVESQRRMIAEAAEKTIGLRAAQRVEEAWRSRSMVPTCPHCREAILPNDGFGNTSTNKAIALRRRDVAKQEVKT